MGIGHIYVEIKNNIPILFIIYLGYEILRKLYNLTSDGSGSDFPGIERVGYFIFLNFRVSSGSGI